MKYAVIFYIPVMYIFRLTFSDKRYVNYSIISEVNDGRRRRACAESYADNEYFAVKIDDVTGSCEGLTWTWGSDQQFEMGYSYLMKKQTVEIFQPWVLGRFQWLLPGTFSLRGRIDIHISVPIGNDWQGFEINLVDTTEYGFKVSDNIPETLMVHITTSYNSLVIKTWKDNIWNDRHSMANPFVGGIAHKISIISEQNEMQVFFGDVLAVQYGHLVSPRNAKQISLTGYGNTIIEVYNITFIA